MGLLALVLAAAGLTLLWLSSRTYERTGRQVEGAGIAAGMLLGSAFWLLMAWAYWEAGPALR